MAGCALALCCAHAAAQDVSFNYQPGTDFSKYRTYKWVEVPGVQYPNQLLDGQIKQAIDAQLSTKGLTKTADNGADLYVTYQLAVDKEKEWSAFSTGGGPMWGGWGGWGGMSSTTVMSETIHIGTLNLDIYDAAAKNQVWRGVATKTIKQQKNPEKLRKNMNKAMAKLLKNYPPPVK